MKIKCAIRACLLIIATSAATSTIANPLSSTSNSKNDVSLPKKLDWHKIPVVFGRSATEEDFEKGIAIYYQRPPGTVYKEIVLPSLAELKDKDGKTEKVIIVQTEGQSGKNDVIVGYRSFSGGTGVALLSEMHLLSNRLPTNP